MKKVLSALALAAGVPPCGGRHQTVYAVRTGPEPAPPVPITVKRRFSKVDGVSKLTWDLFETREAVVTFDDAKTSVQKTDKAYRGCGLPSSSQETDHEDPKTLLAAVSHHWHKPSCAGVASPLFWSILLGVVRLVRADGYSGLCAWLPCAWRFHSALTIYASNEKRQKRSLAGHPKFSME